MLRDRLGVEVRAFHRLVDVPTGLIYIMLDYRVSSAIVSWKYRKEFDSTIMMRHSLVGKFSTAMEVIDAL